MTLLGELLLLGAFVAAGYAAFAAFAADRLRHTGLARGADWATVGSFAALTGVLVVLGSALIARDFRFAYVAQYSSRLLEWHYALSALWVGQAGSLLLWAWLVAATALAYRYGPLGRRSELRGPVLGCLTLYLAFLLAVMLFGADPMASSAATPQEGAGLSPLLQHPAMLIHPPIVFLAYAVWTVPCALALAAMAKGRCDDAWLAEARPWAVCAWAVLGGGILLGADWAYEELGWGGYWGWDPVENGSLIPWLTGTAFIHAAMAARHRGVFQKTSLALAVATFGLCNLATFLTRSGIFSSLHAFSQSPLGWMFLWLMVSLALAAGTLLLLRRRRLAPAHELGGLSARESLVLLAALALVLLAAVAFAGTLVVPLSDLALGRKVVVGPAVYNYTLIPTGLVLLATTAVAPLTRWGKPPSAAQRKVLGSAITAGLGVSVLAAAVGELHPLEAVIAGCCGLAAAAFLGGLILDVRGQTASASPRAVWQTLRHGRRQYAAYVVHLGIVCLAVGIAGSSLRGRQREATLRPGQQIRWEDATIRLVQLRQQSSTDRIAVEAELTVTALNTSAFTLRPAQHWHRLQNEWTTEVDIHADWRRDFYAILHGGEATDRATFTFVVNPLMRWLWAGGLLSVSAAFIALWPGRRPRARSRPVAAMPAPHFRRHAHTPVGEAAHG